MAYPDRDFLPGRRVVLTGAAAAIALPATAWAEIPKSLVTGAMARFKPAHPPKPMPDLEFLDADDKPLRLANPTTFLAQERTIVEEGFAGDVMGVYDPGTGRFSDLVI